MSDDKDLTLPEVQERYTNDLNRPILWTMGGALFLRNSSPESMFFWPGKALLSRESSGSVIFSCSLSTTQTPFY